MSQTMTDREFDLLGKIDDCIDEWYASTNRRQKRIHLRRLNRCLLALGEAPYPDFRRVKAANLETVSRWNSGTAGDIYGEIALFMIDRQRGELKVRVEIAGDGTAAVRGRAVSTNLGFFQDYCDANDDVILEAMIKRWAKERTAIERLSDAEFEALCKGRKQTVEECLSSFFGDSVRWMTEDESVKDALEEAVENLELWAEWEREDAQKTIEAKAALAAWKEERGM